ncbi:hypothetical protein F4825DRAFT_66000 [Nemania diffusa]|nr:hypothetical protein F4825DRAFT_66000 [Nemania diffusa]
MPDSRMRLPSSGILLAPQTNAVVDLHPGRRTRHEPSTTEWNLSAECEHCIEAVHTRDTYDVASLSLAHACCVSRRPWLTRGARQPDEPSSLWACCIRIPRLPSRCARGVGSNPPCAVDMAYWSKQAFPPRDGLHCCIVALSRRQNATIGLVAVPFIVQYLWPVLDLALRHVL